MESQRLLDNADEHGELYHLSLYPEAPTTIVLIHGLLSSSLEWAYVTPHLADYHLLVVDAPGHSKSAHLLPARIPEASDRVADLIRNRAHGGRAHVVGLSMGGFITLDLARRYPELLLSAFSTGSAPPEGAQRFMATHPSLVWYLLAVLESIPDKLYWWMVGRLGMLRHDELRAEMRLNRRWEVVKSVYSSIMDLGWEEVRGIREVRTLAAAGELQDPVEPLRRMGLVWAEGEEIDQAKRKVVVVRGAVHAWDLQMPVLFSEGIKAWVEDRELPEQFEEI